ncbi:hypothetical protein VDS40_22635 [Xanthomonas campestris pv. campestris]|nr:hypothetical protein [Xanthomonas campestris pv. campestris]
MSSEAILKFGNAGSKDRLRASLIAVSLRNGIACCKIWAVIEVAVLNESCKSYDCLAVELDIGKATLACSLVHVEVN